MRKRIYWAITLFIPLLPNIALAAEESVKQLHWWQYVTGIIAIPAGIMGLFYSFVLIRKTRLEARKTELEIHEKEKELRTIVESGDLSRELVTPLLQSQRVLPLLLRFVLLSVALLLWGLLDQVYGWVFSGTFFAVQQVANAEMDFSNMWVIIPVVLLRNLPDIGEWIIILGLGLPLFREITSLLGINVRGILMPWKKGA